jgi:hypothetical protein
MKINWLKHKDVSSQDLTNILKRIERAFNIVELNKQEPLIFKRDKEQQLFEVRSIKDKDKFYKVDADIKTCSCPDFNFRLIKCKHIFAAEFAAAASATTTTTTLLSSSSSSCLTTVTAAIAAAATA